MEHATPLEPAGWWVDVVEPSKEPPPVLYHYCSIDAFVKIVTCKQLWLTNLFFMNDSKEHFWLRDKARNHIEGRMLQQPEEFGYQYLDTILKQEWIHEIYCACFSENGDLLSQWRSYTDDGTGVSIGFSTSHLLRICTTLRGHLCDVIYDDIAQTNLLDSVFDLPESQGDTQTVEQGATTILSRLSEAASRCKNRAFAEEAEWRLICEPASELGAEGDVDRGKVLIPRFRSRNGTVIPYMEVPFIYSQDYTKRGMEPIKEIYFGPRTSAKLQEYAVTLMLRQADFRRVRLLASSATYR